MEQEIVDLTSDLSGWIDDGARRNVEEYLYHSEWGCAWYELWATVSQSGRPIPKALFDRLVSIGDRMGEDVEIANKMPIAIFIG